MGNSIIVYRGRSMLGGPDIRAVLTPASRNEKTGDMAQLWILVDKQEPLRALKAKADRAICGDCPFRPANKGGCYVVVSKAPTAVYRGSKGKRVDLQAGLDVLRKRMTEALDQQAVLRLGAYGDPAAVPPAIIDALAAAVCGRITGYTHQWRSPTSARLRYHVMASVENERDALLARSRGWRTFRVAPRGTVVKVAAETLCLSEARGMTCASCGLCNGASRAKSIYIPAHGYTVRRAERSVA